VSTDANRVPFEVCPPAGIDHMNESICLPEIVEELVAQAPALVRVRDEPGDIKHLDRHEPGAVLAQRVVGVALRFEVDMRALASDIADTSVRLYRRERIGRDLRGRESQSREESGFPDIGLSDYSDKRVAPPKATMPVWIEKADYVEPVDASIARISKAQDKSLR